MSRSVLGCCVLAALCFAFASTQCLVDGAGGVRCGSAFTSWTPDAFHPVNWAQDCNFEYEDYELFDSSLDACKKRCAMNARCTHFTYDEPGMCHLKSNARPYAYDPTHKRGDICGYVPDRTDFELFFGK